MAADAPPRPDFVPAADLDEAVRRAVLKDNIDLRLPLLPQIDVLADDYDRWVHAPIAPKRAAQVSAHVQVAGDVEVAERWPSSLRIFKHTWLERMSHIRWWHILVIWVPIVVGLYAVAVGPLGLGVLAALAWAFVGLFAWTLIEYLLHRFAFHYKPRSGFGRRLHFLAHGVHHVDPWDPTRLVFPPLAGLGIAAALFGFVWLALPIAIACALMAGLLVGYIAYDMTHYYTHHGRPRSRWGKALKAWHLAHHHKDWDAMYGVSQPLWDYVFRTTPAARGLPSDPSPSPTTVRAAKTAGQVAHPEHTTAER